MSLQVKDRARYIQAGILSLSVLTFTPVLGMVQSHTPAGATKSSVHATILAPAEPTAPPANSYRSNSNEDRTRNAPASPSQSTQVQPNQTTSDPTAPRPVPHTRSRGS